MLRSKRSWGYSDHFMATVGPGLTLTARDIEQDHVEVIETEGVVAGLLRVRRRPYGVWLEDLFVDPDAMGEGHGARLFRRAIEVARWWGASALEVESDPNAEAFYRRLGCVRVGTIASTTIPGRSLPHMRCALEPGAEDA